MEAVKDLFYFMKQRKKWFLVPMILLLVAFGTLLIMSSGSVVAPFIYTLF